jgi:hypothetical protein
MYGAGRQHVLIEGPSYRRRKYVRVVYDISVWVGMENNESGQTGLYYDDEGHPMQGSALVMDPKFQERVVTETRALLSRVPE